MFAVRSIITFLLLVLMLFACKKNNEPATINVILDDTISPPFPMIDDFPNEIGYKWTYLVFDAVSDFTDTMHVEVTRDTIINNSQHLNFWNYTVLNGEPFFRCVESNDTIGIYYNSAENYIPGWPYIFVRFPLYVGDSMGYKPDMMHKYAVIAYDTIELKAGRKYLAHEIKNSFFGLNDNFWDKFWFVKKVGIVRYERHSMYLNGDGPIQELISFDFSIEGK